MSGDLYSFLLHLHSIGRWLLLLLLLVAIFNSLIAGRRPFIKSDARTGSFLVILADIMFLVGLSLWLFGPRGLKTIQALGMSGAMKGQPADRFFAVEHITMMLIAIILLHIGKAQGRKAISDRAKHTRTVVFYLLALLLILISIPWPFRQVGGHWY